MNPRKLILFTCLPFCAFAQDSPPAINLENALVRARQYGGQVQSANLAVLTAREDWVQARANRLPSLNAFNQFIYTEGNGTPSGVFVANDGVHVYSHQAIVHQEVLAFFRQGEVRRALAAEAVAQARVEVAARGLNATIIQDYFAIVSAQRKLTNAQTALQQSQRFYEITQQLEQGGEAAHSDVVKAQIDLRQRQRDLADQEAAIQKSKIALGVFLFPTFTAEFNVVDDLSEIPVLEPLAEAQAQAYSTSPDLQAARTGVLESGYEVTVARYAYLPSFAIDFFYGINANQFAVRTHYPDDSGPNGMSSRQNLGYVAQATLNIPVWNWGITRSKVKQAELKRDQARLDLTLAGRTLQGNLAAAYTEARAAQAQLGSLRESVDLSNESLRLTLLRYQAGEATALEVVDAQTTLNQARNAYDDGLARYRIAIASVQTLTGTL
ncbi:MAG: TolC family protein [Bryobacterales bacterium]|nr:TolC family protein [Bryobacterales bacterium]MBV9398107.1 TolC family protein [Bryobacterales bacterium]